MQLQLFKGNAHIQKVTIRHLLSMRSGIKDYDGDQVSDVCTPSQLPPVHSDGKPLAKLQIVHAGD